MEHNEGKQYRDNQQQGEGCRLVAMHSICSTTSTLVEGPANPRESEKDNEEDGATTAEPDAVLEVRRATNSLGASLTMAWEPTHLHNYDLNSKYWFTL